MKSSRGNSSIRCALDWATKRATDIREAGEARRMNFRLIDAHTLGISLDETTTERDLVDIWRVFNDDRAPDFSPGDLAREVDATYPARWPAPPLT